MSSLFDNARDRLLSIVEKVYHPPDPYGLMYHRQRRNRYPGNNELGDCVFVVRNFTNCLWTLSPNYHDSNTIPLDMGFMGHQPFAIISIGFREPGFYLPAPFSLPYALQTSTPSYQEMTPLHYQNYQQYENYHRCGYKYKV